MSIDPGFEIARMDTIFPRNHDIPFDFIVTEDGSDGTGLGSTIP